MNRYFLQLKSFGDLVIATYSVKNFGHSTDIILCGNHLKSLATSLNFDRFQYLELGDENVPAYFNVKRSGLLKAILNYFTIRQQIKKFIFHENILCIDNLGIKERILYEGHKKLNIKSGDNIYEDYARFLGINKKILLNKNFIPGKKIVIYPESRVSAKSIPNDVLSSIKNFLEKRGYIVDIVFAGKNRDDFYGGFYLNGFDSLVRNIKKYDSVISSDSLTAHLAEFYSIPVFVLSPAPNYYWLPKSSFYLGSHSLFNNWHNTLERFYNIS